MDQESREERELAKGQGPDNPVKRDE
jgi:hypothetical protein